MALRDKLHFANAPLYLMDGTAFIFRGFYAYQNMTRSDGLPTNALFIVTRLVLKLLREEKPSRFVFLMDGKGPNFRHELFPAYKAQRDATPEGLVAQLAPTRNLLSALGLPVLVSEGCEADDCIASLAARFKAERPVVIIGADKDLKQCLDENVALWDPGSKDEKLTTLAAFREAEGLEPASWPDYQAVIGDSSDNIPGVPGIGPKTATELFRDFPTLEAIRDRFAAVPPKIAKKLEGRLDDAFLYRRLTMLRRDVCDRLRAEDTLVRPVDMAAALALLEEYELRSLARELSSMDRVGLTRPGSFNAAPEKSRPAGEADAPQGEAPVPQGEAPAGEKPGPVFPAAETARPESQLSLFDMDAGAYGASGPDGDAAPDLPRVADLAGLADVADCADLSGKILALIPHGETRNLILAVAGRTLLYTGDGGLFAAHLAARLPERIVTPDLKALYSLDPAWRALP
ncbi:MAG: DNA polymerase I, partial [Deltaproteobacteria bacterium]|nr:DNA polymerase I [Deltaproteobacteria bacterium]